MDGSVLEKWGVGATRAAGGEAFGPEPVGEPGHVAVTVERVGDKVETCQTADNS